MPFGPVEAFDSVPALGWSCDILVGKFIQFLPYVWGFQVQVLIQHLLLKDKIPRA